MDPNQCLKECLDLADTIQQNELTESDSANELAERVFALHDWLRKGGFLPKQWNPL